jgi:hypothetical protein
MSLDSAKTLVLSLVRKLGLGGEEGILDNDGMFTLTLEQAWMPQIHICYIKSFTILRTITSNFQCFVKL